MSKEKDLDLHFLKLLILECLGMLVVFELCLVLSCYSHFLNLDQYYLGHVYMFFKSHVPNWWRPFFQQSSVQTKTACHSVNYHYINPSCIRRQLL
jgi:hypothetical protein